MLMGIRLFMAKMHEYGRGCNKIANSVITPEICVWTWDATMMCATHFRLYLVAWHILGLLFYIFSTTYYLTSEQEWWTFMWDCKTINLYDIKFMGPDNVPLSVILWIVLGNNTIIRWCDVLLNVVLVFCSMNVSKRSIAICLWLLLGHCITCEGGCIICTFLFIEMATTKISFLYRFIRNIASSVSAVAFH